MWFPIEFGSAQKQGEVVESPGESQTMFLEASSDEKVYGPDHPVMATDLNNWAGLLSICICSSATSSTSLAHTPFAFPLPYQGKLEDADPLYARVLEILGAKVGEEHPNYASALNNRAALLEKQVRTV